jgi:hypothetical protein
MLAFQKEKQGLFSAICRGNACAHDVFQSPANLGTSRLTSPAFALSLFLPLFYTAGFAIVLLPTL